MTEELWYQFRNAVAKHDWSEARRLLNTAPNLIHLQNDLGETVLHYLSVENDQEGVAWLFDKGAHLNTKNAFGIPVLFEVAQLKYRVLFAWFVDKGADLKILDEEGLCLKDYLLQFDLNTNVDWLQPYNL